MRRLVLLVAVLLLSLAAIPAGAAPAGVSGNFPARIDLPDGFFPEGIESGRGTSFFVGSLVDGTVWRGDLRTGTGSVLAPGSPGWTSVGIAYEAARDRLWVAGGGPAITGLGDVRVYDASSGALLARYGPFDVGFLNDVAVTKDAVYVTDSFSSDLVVIPLPTGGSLPPASAATTLTVSGDFVLTPSTVNLNGIVAAGDVLLTVQTSTGLLFRVDPATGLADQVDLGGAMLGNGTADGLELLGRTLYVVQNLDDRLTVVRLGARLASGIIVGHLSDPALDVPATVTVSAGRLWAANARFTTPPGPDTAYWITQLPLRP